ncbi:SpoVG family protein [Paludicola sp. MB14-C6]|uniref:SpoVG family protein n=1 Tax=Paludihabitans sp. MB14-C6 TaxID=3070656 RepID=UPI0027DD7552|nr:SpoVG family protein [Paludicola sp. MB14-C6]WMJ22018.1 SpoVG family protein [Paludicola sp. MB14-C6]
MNITDIKIRKLISEGRLRAIISITIEDTIAIHDIKVIEGPTRLFIAMPSRRDDNGVFRDIVHPITPEARTEIEGILLDAYKEHIAQIEAEE